MIAIKLCIQTQPGGTDHLPRAHCVHGGPMRFSLVFTPSIVKHALQNTQNDCHQWLFDSSRVHQIRFLPQTSLEELTALPQTL